MLRRVRFRTWEDKLFGSCLWFGICEVIVGGYLGWDSCVDIEV